MFHSAPLIHRPTPKSELYVWAFYFILIIHARKFSLFSWCTFAVAVALDADSGGALAFISLGTYKNVRIVRIHTGI